jgi:hypothetical protein
MYFYVIIGYLATVSVARLYNVEWLDDRWAVIWKEAVLVFAWRKWGKPRKTSVRIVDLPAKTEPNTCRIRPRASPLCQPIRWKNTVQHLSTDWLSESTLCTFSFRNQRWPLSNRNFYGTDWLSESTLCTFSFRNQRWPLPNRTSYGTDWLSESTLCTFSLSNRTSYGTDWLSESTLCTFSFRNQRWPLSNRTSYGTELFSVTYLMSSFLKYLYFSMWRLRHDTFINCWNNKLIGMIHLILVDQTRHIGLQDNQVLHLLTYLLMELSPSGEAANSAAIQ